MPGAETTVEEFTALDTLLRHLPTCLNHGARAAIITFHSGEDRRANPRAIAKDLSWARR